MSHSHALVRPDFDSFMVSAPTHYDFKNVAFMNAQMNLYAADQGWAQQLDGNLTGWGPNTTYRQATDWLPLPRVRVYLRPFPEQSACSSAFDGVAHFFSPWTHNLFRESLAVDGWEGWRAGGLEGYSGWSCHSDAPQPRELTTQHFATQAFTSQNLGRPSQLKPLGARDDAAHRPELRPDGHAALC